jgi:hypothetical protein
MREDTIGKNSENSHEMILNEIKIKRGTCRIELCEKCPLSLAWGSKSIPKNVFYKIADELHMTDEEKYRILPSTFCAKEILIQNHPHDWVEKLMELIDEVKDLHETKVYDFLLNKYSVELSDVKDQMKSRLDSHRSYVPTNKPNKY